MLRKTDERSAYLGIDTSCYTCSVAVWFDDGVYGNFRKMVPVEQGQIGKRQQETVFFHIRTIPELVQQAMHFLREQHGVICGVGVSVSPTTKAGSYMPVFVPGISCAQSIAMALDVPQIQVSHQQGHLRAAILANDLSQNRRFLAVHLSGGTTEVLLVNPGYQVECIGGTLDASAGQLLDRIGVLLGGSFPAGKYLDELAANYVGEAARFHVKDLNQRCSMSGIESAARREIEKGREAGAVAKGVLLAMSQAICTMIEHAATEFHTNTVLFMGGVSANTILRSIACKTLGAKMNVVFGTPELCTDNAVGVAVLCKEKICSEI